MTAIVLSLVAGALFGLVAVLARRSIRSGANPEVGAVTGVAVGALLAVVVAAVSGIGPGDLHWGELWPFLAGGLVVPGVANVMFTLAIRAIGPSRVGILMGTVPLLSVLVAMVALDERPAAILWTGTVLIVAGGAVLAWDPSRPDGFRRIGILLALICAGLLAGRDNVVRWAAESHDPPALAAAAATLLAGSVGGFTYLLLVRRSILARSLVPCTRAYLLPGLALGAAYSALVVAFEHGKVSIVAPLNATQSLWAVAFAWAFIGRRSEAIGPRLLVAAVLVVAGSAVVGIFR